MTNKPRKEAVEAADEIMTHLSSDRHFGTHSISRENLAEKIERRAIRRVADPLADALEAAKDRGYFDPDPNDTEWRAAEKRVALAALAAYRGDRK